MASLSSNHIDNDIISALLKLRKEEREIVTLYLLAGLKHKEIAIIIQRPESTVRWKYQTALAKLREDLGGEEL